MKRKAVRRLAVPIVLAVSTAAIAVSSAATGCSGDDGPPKMDAGVPDARPDTPVL